MRIIKAPTISPELLEDAVELAGRPVELPVEIILEDRFAAIADSRWRSAPPAARQPLEVGLLGTPMIMVYRLARWTYLLAKLMVRLPYVSLVNLVAGLKVVPELIQGEANPERIAAEAARLLTRAGERDRMRQGLAECAAGWERAGRAGGRRPRWRR